ncbi:MAG TPA: hypothetical protein ENK57_25400 [Polyangiaceae bacterium]|nr:hypothetical protein [Polyangiaceae bacterium]
MNIVITNTVTLNGGDAAILEALMVIVRRRFPQARFTIFDSQPGIAARYHGHDFRQLMHQGLPNKRREAHERRLLAAASLWRRSPAARLLCRGDEASSLATYAAADRVISTGGTYLVEAYDLTHRLFELEICERLGQPVTFFTQSLGPFHDPRNRQALRRAFGHSPLVLLRDERSRRHLLELGVDPTKLHVVADVVFGVAEPDVLEAARERPIPDGGPRRVAISVREWKHFESVSAEEGMARYEAAIAALATRLAAGGTEVVFLSTCQGIAEYWTDDSALAVRIRERLSAETRRHVHVDRRFRRPQDLIAELGTFDLVVATRMHMAIMALVAGTAVLPIAYEFKTEELFERLGHPEWVLAMGRCTPDALAARYDEVVAELGRVEVTRALFEKVGAERSRALRASDLL